MSEKITLFNINNYQINTSDYSNFLHDKKVFEFEEKIAEFVGAKYAVSFNSATSAIFLLLLGKNITVKVPSIIPPVVVNAIITSGNKYEFYDDIKWVGDSYILHTFDDYKVVDSAQKLEKNQFKNECNPNDLMIFSFYPTKPIGSCDGGMIVSDDLDKILFLKEMALNGMSFSENNWERKIKFPGYKMYMNSIQCDIAIKNFEKYESKLERLSYIRDYYNKNLGLNNISSHLYRINTNNRDLLINKLKENKIQSGIHYTSLHNHNVYKINDNTLPNSENESLTTLSIPFHEKLTNTNIENIVKIINGQK
jgi:dTDP-4-amino-4,6-dideoxygalactose transaminase